MQLDTTLIHPNNFTNSVIFSDIQIIEDDIGDDEGGHKDVDMRVVACVLLEMGLSFLGILTNLLGENDNDDGQKREINFLASEENHSFR